MDYGLFYQNYWADLVKGEIIKSKIRHAQLSECKTQAEMDKLLDRWSQEDSAEKIADAIRSVRLNNSQPRDKFLGIF